MATFAVTSDTWFPTLADGDTTLDKVVNHRPAYADAMRDVEAAIWGQDVLDVAILELCRDRIDQLLGVPGAKVPPTAELDERQRLCLSYAEQVLIDAQGVTDADAAAVVGAIGEGGFLVLTYACGFFETTQRARLLLAPGRAT